MIGDTLWECPPASFANLHELAIAFPFSLTGFGSVFEHCRELRVFTLCIKDQYGIYIMDVLDAHPDAFPHLISFKLLSVLDMGGNVTEEIAKFLREKHQLRRIDVLGHNLVNTSFLKILPGLPNLEILALKIRPARLTSAHVKLLEQYVPPRITALFILFRAEASNVKVIDWQRFVSEPVT